MQLPQPLSGIIPPVVTPLSGRDELDYQGLDRLSNALLLPDVMAYSSSAAQVRLKPSVTDCVWKWCARLAGL